MKKLMRMRRLKRSLPFLACLVGAALFILGINRGWWAHVWKDLGSSQWVTLSQFAGALLGALLTVAGTVWVARRASTPLPGLPQAHAGQQDARAPYPGLEAFTAADIDVFFGRSPETNQLLDRLQPTLPGATNRFVTIIGNSGSGKSSLVQAGLASRLVRHRKPWLVLPVMVPGENPLESLGACLASLIPRNQESITAELKGEGHRALVRIIAETRALEGTQAASTLLIVDQVEELLTLAGREPRNHFLDILSRAIELDPHLWIVATMRSEFLSGFLDAVFAGLFRNPVMLGPLSRDSLLDVVQLPARQVGVRFEPESLVQTLADDTGGGDALPLLAYTMQRLYLDSGPSRIITAAAYRALGGVAGAIASQADKVTAELKHQDPQAPVVSALLQLVTLDGTEPTRRRVPRTALSEPERRVLDAFEAARLITAKASGSSAVLEVAHEALFRQWSPLAQEIQSRAEDLQRRAQIERWADEWERSGRKDAYLLKDERLHMAEQWLGLRPDVAMHLPLVIEFINRSKRSDATVQERLSDAVARRAIAIVERDPEQSLLLALSAIEECTPTPMAHRALLAALSVTQCSALLAGHDDVVRDADWSADGLRLATACDDGFLRVWARDGWRLEHSIAAHSEAIRRLAWSPGNEFIATGSEDRAAKIWDAKSGRLEQVLQGHEGAVRGLAWSLDGAYLATASDDGTARIWDAKQGTVSMTLAGHTDMVMDVRWSPDGETVASGSRDRTVRLWDARTGRPLQTFRGHHDAVRALSWAPDGSRLASASRDRTVRLWNVGEAATEMTLHGHDDGVRSVSWSPDGRVIATASDDRTARLWDASTGLSLSVMLGHSDIVRCVTWSPGGQHIASTSSDHVARIWEARGGGGFRVFDAHGDWANAIAWSPAGDKVVTGSDDGWARLWNVEGDMLVNARRCHEDGIRTIAWSPRGDLIVTGSTDRTAKLWNAGSWAHIRTLHGHEDVVLSAAWSPSGRYVATVSDDRTLRIWSVDSPGEPRILRGHRDVIRSVAWSPSGDVIATGSDDRTVKIWQVDGAAEDALTLRGHANWVECVAWAPAGDRLASASGDKTVIIWDASSAAQLHVLRGHDDSVRGVAWRPDGTVVATGSADRTARLWDSDSGHETSIVAVHRDQIQALAWSPDGKLIATVSRDRTAQVWSARVDYDNLVARARRRVFRKLTASERRGAMLPDESQRIGLAG